MTGRSLTTSLPLLLLICAVNASPTLPPIHEDWLSDLHPSSPPKLEARDDVAVTDEDIILQTSEVLENDHLGVQPTLISGFDEFSAQGGRVLDNADGTFSYVPPDNYYGQDSFSYSITDSLEKTSSADVLITISSVDDIPVATNDSIQTDQNTPVTMDDVLANDSLGDEPTTVSAFDSTSLEGGSIAQSGHTFDYTPAQDFIGDDSFNYTISDTDGQTSTASVAVTVNEAAALKLMAIGDSITEGGPVYHTYRFFLSQSNPELDFVGSKVGVANGQSPSDGNFDQDHQSYWGWRTDQVATEVDWAADVYAPDIALIHLGTNDFFQQQSTASTISELGEIIQHLRDANTNVQIFVAETIDCTNPVCGAPRAELNAAIISMAAELSTSESPVTTVSMDSVTTSDLYDGLHPNSQGSEKMSQNFEAALSAANLLSRSKKSTGKSNRQRGVQGR